MTSMVLSPNPITRPVPRPKLFPRPDRFSRAENLFVFLLPVFMAFSGELARERARPRFHKSNKSMPLNSVPLNQCP